MGAPSAAITNVAARDPALAALLKNPTDELARRKRVQKRVNNSQIQNAQRQSQVNQRLQDSIITSAPTQSTIIGG